MIKVLIVDDHTSVREAFKEMFEKKDDFCVVDDQKQAERDVKAQYAAIRSRMGIEVKEV